MLARHHAHRRLETLQDLGSQIQLLLAAELGKIASVEDEIRLRTQAVDIIHRTKQLAHEALVALLDVQMGVRDVSEVESGPCTAAFVRMSDVDRQEALERIADAGCHRRRRSSCGHLQEAASVEAPQAAKQRVTLFQIARLDTLDMGNF